MNFEAGINGYLSYLKVRRFQEKTVNQQRTRLTVLLDFINNCKIADITPEILQKFFESSTLQKLARGTYNHYISNVRSIFNYCHAIGWIKENPAILLEYVKEEEPVVEYLG